MLHCCSSWKGGRVEPAPPVHALLQVKEVADRLQEKIQLLKSEVKVREKIQKVMRRTQLLLKTEVPGGQAGGQA